MSGTMSVCVHAQVYVDDDRRESLLSESCHSYGPSDLGAGPECGSSVESSGTVITEPSGSPFPNPSFLRWIFLE